jgi:heterodisulfide reductase subunit B
MIDDQKKKVQFKTYWHNTIQENKFVGKQEQLHVITTACNQCLFLKGFSVKNYTNVPSL